MPTKLPALLVLVVLAIVGPLLAPQTFFAPSAAAARSEICVETEPLYVLGTQVSSGTRHCVPSP